jgi:DNA-binding transcriptional LysR family regulator
MELRHLRYFVAVASDEHLGKAAHRLHVSTSPLSRQIRQLEEEVGVALFQRVGRGLRLTYAGNVFLRQAREILAGVERAIALAQSAGLNEGGDLSIGFVDTPMHADLLAEIIPRFRERHGSVGVRLLPMLAEELWAALRARHIDVALTYVSPVEPEIRSQMILTERIMLVVPRSHPLAAREAVYARELKDESFIWMTCGDPGEPNPIHQALVERGLVPRIAMRSRSATAGLNLVASGFGLAFALESATAPLRDRVVAKPLADVHVEVSALWAWTAELEESLPLRALRELTAQVRGAPPPASHELRI